MERSPQGGSGPKKELDEEPEGRKQRESKLGMKMRMGLRIRLHQSSVAHRSQQLKLKLSPSNFILL